jgi:hypothetical protein
MRDGHIIAAEAASNIVDSVRKYGDVPSIEKLATAIIEKAMAEHALGEVSRAFDRLNATMERPKCQTH